MSNKNILKQIEEATKASLGGDLRKFAESTGTNLSDEGGVKTAISQFSEAYDYVYGMFTRETLDGKPFTMPDLSIEAMYSSDNSVVFKRVIGEQLVKPTEPNLFLTNNVAKKVTLDAKAPLSITFPTINAFQAFDVPEGGSYKPQSLTFQEHITSLRLKKIGVLAAINEEIIAAAIYPLIALHFELMANGIARRQEEHCYQALVQKALEVFNNDEGVVASRTTGVDLAQVWNGSLGLDDILKLQATIVGNRYNPSHILVQPLAYNIIFQDPLIRATFFHRGQMGGSIYDQGPNFDQAQNMPFGLTYVPYYALPYTESGVMATAPASGFAAALLTDVYVIDSSNAMTLLQRGDIELEDWDDWFKDAKVLKGRKYMGVAAMDGGKGMTVARNVRVVKNNAPLYVIKSV